MQELFRKHFWAVGLITVMGSAVLAARATSHMLEAALISEVSLPTTPVPRPAGASPSAGPTTLSKANDGSVERNVFCYECTPAVATGPATPGSEVPVTSLSLSLIATNLVLNSPEDSFVSIRNTQDGSSGAFKNGDKLPVQGDARLVAIAGTFAYLAPDYSNRPNTIERLVLGEAAIVQPSATPTPLAKPPEGGDLVAEINAGIKKIDEFTYEIDAGARDKAITNLRSFRGNVKPRPAIENGQVVGYRFFGIRPDSPLYALGLRNGDTINSVNGHALDSDDKALSLYNGLKNETQFSLGVTRRNQGQTLKYTVR